MKRLATALSTFAALTLPQLASAQTTAPTGNNPTAPGIYLGGALGVNVLDDTDFEANGVVITAESDVGFSANLWLGYSMPIGDLNLRAEGELLARSNDVDQVDIIGVDFDALDNSDISTLAGMVNAHLDYYVLPNTAVSVGFGIGYASVQADLAADIGGVNFGFFDEEDDSGFAYQGRLGARYNFSGNTAVDLGYTYFAVDDLTITNEGGNDTDFDYLSHSFHLGLSYLF